MPEVNDENCKPANIDKVSALHQKDFAEKCFKRGTVSSSSRDKAY
ncbi:TPA: entry exclusion lipoprotein TrbK [Escherichia coli]